MHSTDTKQAVRFAKHSTRWTGYLIALVTLTVVILAPSATWAQIAGTADLQGTVSDSTGAVVANAGVTLTDEATLVKRATHSDGSGIYIFPDIPAGAYDLTVASKGFKTYEQKGVVLEVGSNISINPSLTVGSADIVVQVNAAGTQQLQTEDPTFKQTLTGNEV